MKSVLLFVIPRKRKKSESGVDLSGSGELLGVVVSSRGRVEGRGVGDEKEGRMVS